jgi:hypothetical protein
LRDGSFPIRIGEEDFLLLFEDGDVEEIEKTISIFEAFHPHNRTYENAAIILWHGLRKINDDGNLVYAIQQGPTGKIMARQMVKQFCGQFPNPLGMIVLYGSFDNAFIAGKFYKKPEPVDEFEAAKKAPVRDDAPKNSQRPITGPTTTLHSVFAGLRRKLSGIIPRQSS